MVRAFGHFSQVVHYLTPSLLIVTYLLALALINYERINGLRSSTLLLVFWGLTALVNVIPFRTNVLHFMHKKTHKDVYTIYLFFAFYALVVINMVITCFSENYRDNKEPIEKIEQEDTDFLDDKSEKLKVMPENHVPLLSKLLFWWINDLILTGHKRDLVRSDLWSIDTTESSEYITKKLEVSWQAASAEYIKNVKNLSPLDTTDESTTPTKKKPKNKRKNEIYKSKTQLNEEEIKLTDNVDVSFKQPPNGAGTATKTAKKIEKTFARFLSH
jgi:hypothetical protein